MSGVGTAPSVDTLIKVTALTVNYASARPSAPALADITLDIRRGEVVGVLGESGSGKSTLALSMLGMLPADAKVQGSISLRGKAEPRDLLRFDDDEWRAVRGAKLSMIFQEPGLCLSPVMRVGDQIAEILRAHGGKKSSHRERVHDLLRQVRFSDTERIYRAYPHQLSGG